MKNAISTLFLSISVAVLAACNMADVSQGGSQHTNKKNNSTRYSASDFFSTVSLLGSSVNHDNSAVLISNDSSGIYNVYSYPTDGSASTRLTHSQSDVYRAESWFPKDNRFLVSADQGGNELDHLYVFELDGSSRDLTPGKGHKARFLGWKNDGRKFFVATNEREFSSFDLYAYSTTDYQRTLVFKNTQALRIDLVSPDGNWLALVQPNNNADNDLYLADLEHPDSAPRLMTKHSNAARLIPFSFTPDSKNLVYGSNEQSEFQQAWTYSLSTQIKSPLIQSDWDITSVQYSPGGRFRVVEINANAQTSIDITDTTTGQRLLIDDIPTEEVQAVSFSADEKLMVLQLNADNAPPSLYVHIPGENRSRKITDTLNTRIKKTDLVSSDRVTFESFDGTSIPGLLYKPLQASPANPVPALILIHGGPGGQSRREFNPMIQHLVNNGYGVFAVNNRGSSGYGKTFFHLDDQRHGEDDLQDIVFGKQYLQSLNWIETNKIGVIGKSYGGYLTMAAMAFTKEFEVGINMYGVTNWVRTLQSIPPWLDSFRKVVYTEMGDPAVDSQRHRRISPLFHADKIRKPVLIVQGANDPRVLQIESDEMVSAMRSNGVYVEYILFDDEGHGLKNRSNRIAASEAFLGFLDTHLSKR